MSNSEITRFNHLDTQYQSLLQDILYFGKKKGDRTGTGTLSIFGRHLSHSMNEGFPLLTTKKMAWKAMATELIWFLRGDTNIKFLVENNCNIWNGDAYKRYTKLCSANSDEWNAWMRDNGDGTLSMYASTEFIEKIKTDNEFANMWGDLGPIYGKQWRDWNYIKESGIENSDGSNAFEGWWIEDSIDQIANLIHDLKNNPDSRRLMVNAWNVPEVDKAVLPPCHYGFQCWTRELTSAERFDYGYHVLGYEALVDCDNPTDCEALADSFNVPKRALSLMWNQRSVDTFLGLPFNIASYGLLLMILAKEVNMIPEQLKCALGDTHLYLNHLEAATEQTKRTKFQLPTMELNYDSLDELIKNPNYLDCFKLVGYQSHESIKAELSN